MFNRRSSNTMARTFSQHSPAAELCEILSSKSITPTPIEPDIQWYSNVLLASNAFKADALHERIDHDRAIFIRANDEQSTIHDLVNKINIGLCKVDRRKCLISFLIKHIECVRKYVFICNRMKKIRHVLIKPSTHLPLTIKKVLKVRQYEYIMKWFLEKYRATRGSGLISIFYRNHANGRRRPLHYCVRNFPS